MVWFSWRHVCHVCYKERSREGLGYGQKIFNFGFDLSSVRLSPLWLRFKVWSRLRYSSGECLYDVLKYLISEGGEALSGGICGRIIFAALGS